MWFLTIRPLLATSIFISSNEVGLFWVIHSKRKYLLNIRTIFFAITLYSNKYQYNDVIMMLYSIKTIVAPSHHCLNHHDHHHAILQKLKLVALFTLTELVFLPGHPFPRPRHDVSVSRALWGRGPMGEDCGGRISCRRRRGSGQNDMSAWRTGMGEETRDCYSELGWTFLKSDKMLRN